jgi:tetratricopeptide (TPR) repeat protein
VSPPETPFIQPTRAAVETWRARTDADPRDDLSAAILAELSLRLARETGLPADFDAAAARAQEAVRRAGTHAPSTAVLIHALTGAGRLKDAREAADAGLRAHPRSMPVLVAAFELAESQGRAEDADGLCERALAVGSDPGALACAARVRFRKGDIDGAVEFLRKAALDAEELGGLPPEIASYFVRSAGFLDSAGRASEALAEADQAITWNPRDADAWLLRARLLARTGDAAASADALAKARAVRPEARLPSPPAAESPR